MERGSNDLRKPKRQRTGASYARRSVAHVSARRQQITVNHIAAPEPMQVAITRLDLVKRSSSKLKSAFQGLTLERIRRMVRWWRWQDAKYRWKWRTANVLAAALILSSAVLPALGTRLQEAHYSTAQVESLVKPTVGYLNDKLKYNSQQQLWQFNADAANQLPSTSGDSAKVGGVSYSAQLPTQLTKTSKVTLTDARSKIDIGMVPQFDLYEGKQQGGYMVYPLQRDNGQLIYTFRPEGVKEDIVLYQSPGKTASYSYKLQLPSSLEARLLDDGSVGIFGGSKSLFGNISYGSDADKALVEKARQNSKKDQLYYVIPAPTIAGDTTGKAVASFDLQGDTLTVKATGLEQAHYPLSIDPSFIMDTSGNCSWRGYFSDDGAVDYSGCQLARSSLSGATVTWASNPTGFVVADTFVCTAVANGVMYAYGRTTGVQVYSATINPTTGELSTFTNTNSDLSPSHGALSCAAANGYLYAIGGQSGLTPIKTVHVGKPNANGTVTWTQTADTNVARAYTNSAAYGGYLYVSGGCSSFLGSVCTGYQNTTEYAKIRADGTIAGWTNSTTFTTGRWGHGMAAYNGHIYIVGGDAAGSASADTQMASIKSDGSLSSWSAQSTLATAVTWITAVTAYNGYLYVIGGYTGSNAQNTTSVAKIYADGTIGPYRLTNNFITGRSFAFATTYNGRIYMVGGTTDGNVTKTANIQIGTVSTTPRELSPITVESDEIVASPNGVHDPATVAYGGYLYVVGGEETTGRTNKTYFAKLNTDGSTGAWALAANQFTENREGAAAVAHNGYLYVIGGLNSIATTNCPGNYCKDVQKAAINPTTGDLGAWSSAGGFYSSNPRNRLGVAVFNDYMYVIGGNTTGTSFSNEVNIAPINTDGTVGTWTTDTTAMPAARGHYALAQSGKYVYLVGGDTAAAAPTNTALYATLSSGGGISSFTSAGTNMTSARGGLKAGIYDGYLYIAGGRTGYASTAPLNTIQYIKLNADGTFNGSWVNSPVSLSTARADHMSVIANGYLYTMAGCSAFNILNTCDTRLRNVEYAQLYNGGGGQPNAAATNATNITTERSRQGTVVSNGFMYLLGGDTYTGTYDGNSVLYSPLSSDGSLSFSQTSSMLGIANHKQSAAWTTYNGYVYALGGGASDPFNNQVQYAAICTGRNSTTAFGTNCTTSSTPGTLSSWAYTYNSANNGVTQVGGMTTARIYHQAQAAAGKLYAIGGCATPGAVVAISCAGMTNGVEVATLNADGTVGSWSSASGFTTARMKFSSQVYGNYLYVMGGCVGLSISLGDGTCNVWSGQVQYAQLTSSGLAADAGCGSAWCVTNGFGGGRQDFGTAGANGYLYVVGGSINSLTGSSNEVQYAPIYADGRLGSWQTQSNAFTTPRNALGAIAAGGYLYTIGGCSSGSSCSAANGLKDVQYMGLQSTPQIARHSMLLSTDARTLPANFFSNVSAQTAAAQINVELSTTADPAIVFGSSGVQWGIVSTAKYPLITGNDGTKYYWVYITIDDSRSMTFGEPAGSSMSYLQLNYHPNPAKRLRGGKTFNGEKIQSLDAR